MDAPRRRLALATTTAVVAALAATVIVVAPWSSDDPGVAVKRSDTATAPSSTSETRPTTPETAPTTPETTLATAATPVTDATPTDPPFTLPSAPDKDAELKELGASLEVWRQTVEPLGFTCTNRPGYEKSKIATCTRTTRGGSAIIDVATNGDEVPARLLLLVNASDEQRQRQWETLLGEVEPIIGAGTVDDVLEQGDGGGTDYISPIDVYSQTSLRAAYMIPGIPGGTDVPPVRLQRLTRSVRAAGGRCDRYSCTGPDDTYSVAYGLVPDTDEIVVRNVRFGAGLEEVWESLGPLGEAVAAWRSDEAPEFATAVFENWMAIRAVTDGREVVVLTVEPGYLRSELPRGERPTVPIPNAPTTPTTEG